MSVYVMFPLLSFLVPCSVRVASALSGALNSSLSVCPNVRLNDDELSRQRAIDLFLLPFFQVRTGAPPSFSLSLFVPSNLDLKVLQRPLLLEAILSALLLLS